MIATGMVTIKAPRYGINTEKPTNTDKRATYSSQSKEKSLPLHFPQ